MCSANSPCGTVWHQLIVVDLLFSVQTGKNRTYRYADLHTVFFFQKCFFGFKYMQYKAEKLGTFLWKIRLYIQHGYIRYLVRKIPEGKDLESIDKKILSCYDITYNYNTRVSRRKNNTGNVVYVRFGHTFILFCDEREHKEFDKMESLDFRTSPLHFSGYSIGIKQDKPCIIIAPLRFKAIRKQAQTIALHNRKKIQAYFENISPFTFKGVATQKEKLLKEINKRRKKAGLPLIAWMQ